MLLTATATACGSDKPDNSKPDNNPASIKNAAQEAVYADQAAKGDPGDLKGVTPSIVAEQGHHICKLLDQGQSVEDAAAQTRLGFSAKETGALIGAAPALCPQHGQAIDAWIAALGQ
nr:DUF732 domain-containing protein [Streptomyces sp. CBMA152]